MYKSFWRREVCVLSDCRQIGCYVLLGQHFVRGTYIWTFVTEWPQISFFFQEGTCKTLILQVSCRLLWNRSWIVWCQLLQNWPWWSDLFVNLVKSYGYACRYCVCYVTRQFCTSCATTACSNGCTVRHSPNVLPFDVRGRGCWQSHKTTISKTSLGFWATWLWLSGTFDRPWAYFFFSLNTGTGPIAET
jgi:hypothetical protein